ncbi:MULTISPECIES: hypothetical protein [unclassified Haloparvum]|uniref:hypothetical protein n=1 Tax=Haloparvum sp. PAK95 TaxID=3418962 RepID=UPI003D2EF91E
MVASGLGGWVVVGVAAGLVGGVVMDLLLTQQEDGFAPARVGVAVLTGRSPVEVPFRDAVVAHHVASGLVGGLYSVLSFAFAALVPTEWLVGGVRTIPHALAVLIVVGFVYFLFTAVVLPRVDDSVYEDRATAIHGQWLRAAALFGAVLLVGVPAIVTVVP